MVDAPGLDVLVLGLLLGDRQETGQLVQVGDELVVHEFFRLQGDFNGDGLVSVLDRTDLMAHFGTKLVQSLYDHAYDLNGDGIINLLDYMAWLKRLGRMV